VPAPGDYDDGEIAGETEVLGENLPQCRFVHHKTHMLVRTRTLAAAVGSQRLTALAMARPAVCLCFIQTSNGKDNGCEAYMHMQNNVLAFAVTL
jgi:hypothetical protein